MSDNPFVGHWTYRSLLNDPDVNTAFNNLEFGRGTIDIADGPMQLLETPDNQWFGYCEGQESSQFITDPQTISTLYMRYAKLLSQALTPEDSGNLLEQRRGAL